MIQPTCMFVLFYFVLFSSIVITNQNCTNCKQECSSQLSLLHFTSEWVVAERGSPRCLFVFFLLLLLLCPFCCVLFIRVVAKRERISSTQDHCGLCPNWLFSLAAIVKTAQIVANFHHSTPGSRSHPQKSDVIKNPKPSRSLASRI